METLRFVLLAAVLLAGAGTALANSHCIPDEYATEDGSGCKTCSASATTCDVCWDGWAVNRRGQCVQCTVPDESGGVHCLTCNPDKPDVCTTCEPYCNTGGCRGYYPVDGACLPCPSTACAECTQDGGTCTSCRKGFGLVDGECRQCLVENCRSCDGDLSRCSECLTPKPYSSLGYFVDPTTGNCTQCPSPCHECAPDGKSCTVCPHSPLDEQTGGCAACEVANCLDCSSDVAECTACNATFGLVNGACEACAVTNCAYCDDDASTCSSCLDGFGLVDGKCEACKGEGCIYCDGDASACTGCQEDWQSWNPEEKACTNCTVENCVYCMNTDSATCSACADSYTNDAATGGCVACKVEGCSYCADYVDKCDDSGCAFGYWEDDGTCAACPDGCDTCDNGKGETCDRCADGYWLNSDRSCVKCVEGDSAMHGACP